MLTALALTLGLAASNPSSVRSNLDQEAAPEIFAEDQELRELARDLQFTEGPVWMPEEGALIFSDIPGKALYRWSARQGLERHLELDQPNGNLLDLDGRLLTCRHGDRDLIRHEDPEQRTTLVSHYRGLRLNSPNDLTLSGEGGIYFTDPPWGLPAQREGRELPGNWVYYLHPRDQGGPILTRVVSNATMPNGLALSADERTLYLADTGGHPSHPETSRHEDAPSVRAFTVLAPGLVDPTPRWRVEERCDGMCLDEEGAIYITTPGGVAVLDPQTGRRIDELVVPQSPANACFGGPDGTTLFITARTSLYSIQTQRRGFHRKPNPPRRLSPRDWDRLGDLYLRQGHPEMAVDAFDRFLAAEPEADPYHWRRGIALYQAGQFAEGARQFVRHRTVNPNDVENATWHFLCVAADRGLEAARKELLPVGPDSRTPMGTIYELFAGKADFEDVLAAIEAAPALERTSARFYGHLYLGIYAEAVGMPEGRQHLELSAGAYGVRGYMGDVARTHVDLLWKE